MPKSVAQTRPSEPKAALRRSEQPLQVGQDALIDLRIAWDELLAATIKYHNAQKALVADVNARKRRAA